MDRADAAAGKPDAPASRRSVLRTLGWSLASVFVGGALAGCSEQSDGGGAPTERTDGSATPANDTPSKRSTTDSQRTVQAAVEGWMEGVSNFEGLVDATDSDRVRVAVGTEGNGGNFAFDPPAVRIAPGTTVVWEWTGEGGLHNVVATDGRFDSGEPVSDGTTTFEHAFSEQTVAPYYCVPHKSLGMKGILVVE